MHAGRPALARLLDLRQAGVMARILACVLFGLVSCFALPACTPCNRSGCDAIRSPAADNGESAIAGAIASESDVIGNGCQECPYASATFSIWAVAAPVTDAASAKAVIQAAPALATFQADGHYRHTVDPGSYLLCDSPSSYEAACVSVHVVAGHVTPVNLKLLFGPFQFIVFDPQTRAPITTATIHPGA
jgi:hypothetical protein